MTVSRQYARLISTTYTFTKGDVQLALINLARTGGTGTLPQGPITLELDEAAGTARMIIQSKTDETQETP